MPKPPLLVDPRAKSASLLCALSKLQTSVVWRVAVAGAFHQSPLSSRTSACAVPAAATSTTAHAIVGDVLVLLRALTRITPLWLTSSGPVGHFASTGGRAFAAEALPLSAGASATAIWQRSKGSSGAARRSEKQTARPSRGGEGRAAARIGVGRAYRLFRLAPSRMV